MAIVKVGVDKGPLESGHAVRGVGFYTRELINGLLELKKDELGNFEIDAIDFRKVDLAKYQLLHYPYFNPYFITFPWRRFSPRQKIVVTIHDLIPLIYPKHYPSGFKGKIRFLTQKLLIKKVDAIITDSETSKKDIVRFLSINQEKIKVVYLAPGDLFKPIKNVELLEKTSKKYNLPAKFVMYLGDVNYNKNIPNLIKACEIAKSPLVICGKQAKELGSVKYEERNLGPRDLVRRMLGKSHPEVVHFKFIEKKFSEHKDIYRLGFVPDEDLVSIFNLASVYVQPSYYEGFGLPVLQAFACGTPVVVSRTNCLTEVANGAALVADPNNPNDLSGRITEVIKNEKTKKELIEKGFERVKEFSWKRTAKETVDVYRTLIGE